MSGGIVNSSILLGLGIVVGLASLVVQTFFWDRSDRSLISGTFSALKSIWMEFVECLTVWMPKGRSGYNNIVFARLAVTFALMAGIIVVVLATYDSVNSFWVFFVLYVGIALLALPIILHILAYLFEMMRKRNVE